MAKSNNPQDLNTLIDFANKGGMNTDNADVQNYIGHLVDAAIENNPAEFSAFVSNPNNQNAIVSDKLVDPVVDHVTRPDWQSNAASTSALQAVAKADPISFYSNENVKGADPNNPNPAIEAGINNITDADLKKAAAQYSPEELSKRLDSLPEEKSGLIPDLLKNSIAAHPYDLKDPKNKEAFEANIEALSGKFPALAGQIHAAELAQFAEECKRILAEQPATANLMKVRHTSSHTSPDNNPLAATGLDWKYQADGTAMLDIASLVNTLEKRNTLMERLDTQHNQGSIENYTIAPDNDSKQIHLIITPEGVNHIRTLDKSRLEELGNAIKGTAPDAKLTTSSAENSATTQSNNNLTDTQKIQLAANEMKQHLPENHPAFVRLAEIANNRGMSIDVPQVDQQQV